MYRGATLLMLFASACSSKSALPVDAAAVVSPECLKAREGRARAALLDKGGHEELALAALAEANTACESEASTSWDMEVRALAEIGKCTEAHALAAKSTDAGTAIATCDAIEAPAKGDDKTFRAKVRDAWTAEHAKDFARAKTLYLEAWAEKHAPHVLEAAARMAEKSGDVPGGRRLRDRALVYTEGAEHAHATLNPVVFVGSTAVVHGAEVTAAGGGTVLIRDVDTNNVRDVIESSDLGMRVSPAGALASAHTKTSGGHVDLWDVPSATILLTVAIEPTHEDDVVFSPDDARAALVVLGHKLEVLDMRSGDTVATLANPDATAIIGFTDRDHVMVYTDQGPAMWDLKTGALSSHIVEASREVGLSRDGRLLCVRHDDGFHIIERKSAKEIGVVEHYLPMPGSFDCRVSDDGKTLVTGGQSSLRLWDVGQKKQTFALQGNFRDTASFDFTDDQKAVVAAGSSTVWSWDIATGKQTALVSSPPYARDARTSRGVLAIETWQGVSVVHAAGDVVSVCTEPGPYQYPRELALSHDGKTLACMMAKGELRTYDAETGTERKRATVAASYDHVALRFTDDDASLEVLTNTDFTTFDTKSGAQTVTTKLKHPTKALVADEPMQVGVPRVPQIFADGTFAVRMWAGDFAFFDKSGTWTHDYPAPRGLHGVFSDDGKRFARWKDKSLTTVDVADGGTSFVAPVAGSPGEVRFSPDGKTLLVEGYVAGSVEVANLVDGGFGSLTDAGFRAHFAGRSTIILHGGALDVSREGEPPMTLQLSGTGVIVTTATGAFDTRGAPDALCVVGKTKLERATCDDRVQMGLIAAWLDRTNP